MPQIFPIFFICLMQIWGDFCTEGFRGVNIVPDSNYWFKKRILVHLRLKFRVGTRVYCRVRAGFRLSS